MYDFKELAEECGNDLSISRQKLSKISLSKKKQFSSSSDFLPLPLIAVKVSLSPRKTSNHSALSEDRKETHVMSKSTKLPAVGNAVVPCLKPKCKRQKSRPPNRTYKYKILPGNNSRAIMLTMKNRPWWHAILPGSSQKTNGENSAEDEESQLLDQQPSFIWEMYRNSLRYKQPHLYQNVLLNHIQRNALLVTKKGLYLSIKTHCLANNIDPLLIIPRTYYLAPGSTSKSMKDDDIDDFLKFCDEEASTRGISANEIVWIMKPASKTNRGFGIKVIQGMDNVLRIVQRGTSADSDTSEVSDHKACRKGSSISNSICDSSEAALSKAARRIAQQDGYIVQLYIEKPLLIHGRKFDIRCYVLVTVSARTELKAYFFNDAYIRTSSKKYSLDNFSDRETHLTNDAVQKNSVSYGKFEEGNKLSLQDWQNIIIDDYPNEPRLHSIVFSHIFPEIKRLSKISVEAVHSAFLETDVPRSFELFGYDYMITSDFEPILIEVNTNPCLEFVCPLLTNIISDVIENTVRLAVDVVFSPPKPQNRTKLTDEAIQQIESQPLKFEVLLP